MADTHVIVAGRHDRDGVPRTLFAAPRLWALVAALLVVVAHAAGAESPPALTAERQAAAQRLEGMLIAPCCFTNTVAEHRSPLSDEVRAEVRARLAGGASESEILDAFVARYGERILAAPRTHGFSLLAYLLPVIALAVGGGVVLLTLRRHRPRPVAPARADAAPANQRNAELDAELARLDG